MGNEGFVAGHRGLLQIGMAGHTAGIVNKFFPVAPFGLPINIFRIAKTLYPDVMYSCLRFGDYVVIGTVMRQMALSASSPDAMGIVAAMYISIMGFFKWFHAVTVDAKLGVRGGGNAFVGYKP